MRTFRLDEARTASVTASRGKGFARGCVDNYAVDEATPS
jgi:hypothetical protein